MAYLEAVLRFILPSYGRAESRTVKFAFPVIFALGAVFGLAALTSSTPSSIRVTASESNVRAGQMVSLYVYVNATTPINAVDISVTIPQNLVEFMGVDTGESVITLWTQDPYYEKGRVYFRGGTFRKGFIGEHLIGVVNVRTKATGLAQFDVGQVQLLAGDGSGSLVAHDKQINVPSLLIADQDGTYYGTESMALSGDVTLQIITDLDGDGSVTLGDVSRFMAAWSAHTSIFDFNGDGRMTFTDFAIILSDSFFK